MLKLIQVVRLVIEFEFYKFCFHYNFQIQLQHEILFA